MTDRLALLREEMKALELDGLLIPHADAHQGEYLPPGAERLAWLTGFTGSAGMAAILRDEAALFVGARGRRIGPRSIEQRLDLKAELNRGHGKAHAHHGLGGARLEPDRAFIESRRCIVRSRDARLGCRGPWRQALAGGHDIAGALWAAWTHADLGDDGGKLLPVGKVPRIFLMSGLTDPQVEDVIERWDATELLRPTFAVATPNNLRFSVIKLLEDLLAEKQAQQPAK